MRKDDIFQSIRLSIISRWESSCRYWEWKPQWLAREREDQRRRVEEEEDKARLEAQRKAEEERLAREREEQRCKEEEDARKRAVAESKRFGEEIGHRRRKEAEDVSRRKAEERAARLEQARLIAEKQKKKTIKIRREGAYKHWQRLNRPSRV